MGDVAFTIPWHGGRAGGSGGGVVAFHEAVNNSKKKKGKNTYDGCVSSPALPHPSALQVLFILVPALSGLVPASRR